MVFSTTQHLLKQPRTRHQEFLPLALIEIAANRYVKIMKILGGQECAMPTTVIVFDGDAHILAIEGCSNFLVVKPRPEVHRVVLGQLSD
jgi:hypothetical protein